MAKRKNANDQLKAWMDGISNMELKGDTRTIDEKMDALLLSLTNEERELLAEKLNGKGNA